MAAWGEGGKAHVSGLCCGNGGCFLAIKKAAGLGQGPEDAFGATYMQLARRLEEQGGRAFPFANRKSGLVQSKAGV